MTKQTRDQGNKQNQRDRVHRNKCSSD
uniref:Uncharacterized protein n=1 Tax=Arundo donax TaxID=35708 RepID=A0A0A9CU98_ARUDO